MKDDDIFNGNGVEVKLPDPANFLKVVETLSRIGIASKKTKTLYQSCHLLHKRGRYIVCSFKELFDLDGKETTITENDLARRNTIAKLLQDWGLVEIVEPFEKTDTFVPVSSIKILPYKEKKEWKLISKYSLGLNKKDPSK